MQTVTSSGQGPIQGIWAGDASAGMVWSGQESSPHRRRGAGILSAGAGPANTVADCRAMAWTVAAPEIAGSHTTCPSPPRRRLPNGGSSGNVSAIWARRCGGGAVGSSCFWTWRSSRQKHPGEKQSRRSGRRMRRYRIVRLLELAARAQSMMTSWPTPDDDSRGGHAAEADAFSGGMGVVYQRGTPGGGSTTKGGDPGGRVVGGACKGGGPDFLCGGQKSGGGGDAASPSDGPREHPGAP